MTLFTFKTPRWKMNETRLAPDIQMTNTSLSLFMQILTDLTASWTLSNFMLVMAEYVQYFSPILLFECIFCDHHSWQS
jgi:hypothetical protein